MADYTRIYSGEDGLSHFEDLDFEYDDLAAAQTPVALGVSAASASPGNVKGAMFRRFALGNSSKHAAPRKQYLVVLTGSLVVQTGDGEERQFGPGQVLLLDDTTGEGHLTTFGHEEPCKCMVVQIEE